MKMTNNYLLIVTEDNVINFYKRTESNYIFEGTFEHESFLDGKFDLYFDESRTYLFNLNSKNEIN